MIKREDGERLSPLVGILTEAERMKIHDSYARWTIGKRLMPCCTFDKAPLSRVEQGQRGCPLTGFPGEVRFAATAAIGAWMRFLVRCLSEGRSSNC